MSKNGNPPKETPVGSSAVFGIAQRVGMPVASSLPLDNPKKHLLQDSLILLTLFATTIFVMSPQRIIRLGKHTNSMVSEPRAKHG